VRRKRWPDEAPVFEDYWGSYCIGIDCGNDLTGSFIEVIYASGSRWIASAIRPVLKPLTPAARAMLAIAHERAS
jgi:hypothetical protein